MTVNNEALSKSSREVGRISTQLFLGIC